MTMCRLASSFLSSRWAVVAWVGLLAACATPQERAIAEHCSAEGDKLYPPQVEMRQVQRSVFVGNRVVGQKERCETTKRTDKEGKEVKETTCHKRDITEPVYELRWFSEPHDLQAPARHTWERSCRARALSEGLFVERNSR